MCKILIVDDSYFARLSMERIVTRNLKQFNPVIDKASNGNEALELMGRNIYDCVLLDLIMPEKNGIDVLGELIKKGKDVSRILVCSGSEDVLTCSLLHKWKVKSEPKPLHKKTLIPAITDILLKYDVKARIQNQKLKLEGIK